MADAPQIWDIPLTPRQRFQLALLAFSKSAPQVTTRDEGKRMRRALRAFGIMPIRDAWVANGNGNSVEVANRRTPALHKITIENLKYALETWSVVPRPIGDEIEVGEVFDMLDEIDARPGEWTPPDDVPTYVPEDWSPPKAPVPAEPEGSITCPSCKQTFDLADVKAATPEATPAP